MNAAALLKDAEQRLMTQYHKTLTEASAQELHNAVSGAAMDALAPVWVRKEKERFTRRSAAYLSMEFLVGRLVYNNLYCMGLLEDVGRLLKEKGNEAEVRKVNGIKMVVFRMTDEADNAPGIGYIFEDGDLMIEVDFWYASQEAAELTEKIMASIREEE